MSDQFAGWNVLLALAQQHKTKAALREAIAKSDVKLNPDNPLSGYYRCTAVKGGPKLPVAIWREGGRLYVMRAGEEVTLSWVWPYCAWDPIPYEWYDAYVDKWPDEPAAFPVSDRTRLDAIHAARAEEVADDAATRVAEQRNVRPGHVTAADVQAICEAADAAKESFLAGHNNPPVEDNATEIKSQIEAAKGVAEQDYAIIDTDDKAAAAQALRSRLLALSGDADKQREAEKKPHWDAAKAVDAKWQPVVKLGQAAADWLRGKLSEYATRKANEQAEADRKRLAEEAAAIAKAEAEGRPADLIAELPPAPATSTTIKGATGRAARITIVKVAKVVDYDAAYAHMKAFPEIKKAIDTAAQRMIAAGNDVPGVEVHDERRVA